ncbi:MAG: 3D-(3,5/4)-trihydroxycyclohexane-1,2-dione acylhydrolase (decyclizing) [Solirubrobacteraceae bacterium]|jgi:3D-(3,5/4)-trihydroxycyclohexane-1,2-dione acylhydrolase (decyclizing)
MTDTVRLTVAQALVRFLAAQEVQRDGARSRFFGGCFGILGHGNVAGLGQAFQQDGSLLAFHQGRNEQAMVHIASGYARQRNRLGALICTTSIGPGATNMITGAALATVNRLPVLLLPSDTFAGRVPHPVLQQLEVFSDQTVTVNDCFRPVSRFFDRVQRPEQLYSAALEAMRVLTDPADTGAVTIALPEDVQTEACDWRAEFFAARVWMIDRRPPAVEALARAAEVIGSAQRPLIVAGGGVIYSEAMAALAALVDASGIPVCETQAGRGALVSDHPLSLGAVGATGSAAGNRLARDADVVIGVGTRWGDFTTASKSAFQDPGVRFINVNVTSFDAAKHSGVSLLGDARVVLEALRAALGERGWRAPESWSERAAVESAAWADTVAGLVAGTDARPLRQAEVIGAVNDAAGETGVVVNAAGAMPGDLHKLWRARDPAGKGYHVEYGYSCMGYEIPGSIGIKLAAPDRRVFCLIGDGTWLMLSSELATAVAERIPLTVILVDNQGYMSIGALSRSVGSAGFATHYQRAVSGGPVLDAADGTGLATSAQRLPVDFAANAASLGARVVTADTIAQLRSALVDSADADGPVVICVEVDRYAGVPDFAGWWEVPVAETSTDPNVQRARERYEHDRRAQRQYLETP